MILPNGMTVSLAYEKSLEKARKVQEEMDLAIYWECEIHEMLRKDARMKEFFHQCVDTGPISPRDAFLGGRTGALYLHYIPPKGKSIWDKPMKVISLGYKITYKDFVSLYPSVNATCRYPISHAKVRVFTGARTFVHWYRAQQNPYKGLLKVLVEPPEQTPIPVLPKRLSDNRLVFPLCGKCAEYYNGRQAPAGTSCQHKGLDRCFEVRLKKSAQ